MIVCRRNVSFLAASSFALAACGSHDNSAAPAVQLPSFHDVSDAPAVIQAAAEAVVRIETAGEAATGSFISATGLLLTNNHVLGVDICPIEGCFAQITQMYQRGQAPVPTPLHVFVVPIAVDVGLDMAVVQTYTADASRQMLSTPQFLTISARDPAQLQGTHINVVGHPEGHLKKWSPGEIVDSDGTWIWTSAYSLPGNSGSPFLDDNGQLVGILHRGPTAQDLVSTTGVDEFSIGTASSALSAAMSAALPAAMLSTAASTTDDVVVSHDLVYLNAHTPNANVNGTPKPVITSLGEACDAGLARTDYESPDDLSAALAPCTDALQWINCASPATDGSSVCPDDAAAWVQRYQAVYDHWIALNGDLELEMLTFGMAALMPTNGQATATQNLQAALAAANPPFDFNIAFYLATFNVPSYAGVTTLDFLNAYKTFPDYALSGTQIVQTALSLYQNQELGSTAALNLLQTLAADPTIDIGTKLYIEDVQYQSSALN